MFKKISFILILTNFFFLPSLCATKLLVYTNNLAMVNESYEIEPREEVEITNLPAYLLPETVFVQNLEILEQEFLYDLMDVSSLTKKFEGKKVTLNHEDEFSEVILLKQSYKDRIFLLNNSLYLNMPGQLILDAAQAVKTPTLKWRVEPFKKTKTIELEYLTENISYNVSYLLNLGKENILSSWLNITNHCGRDFENIDLLIFLGDVNFLGKGYRQSSGMQVKSLAASGVTSISSKVGKYSIYQVPFRTTLNNNSTKNITFIKLLDLLVNEKIEIHALQEKNYAITKMEFLNSTDYELAKGRVKVYKNDVFIGENFLPYTSKNEKVSLETGKLFNVYATKKQLEYRNINKETTEQTFEIKVNNFSEKTVELDLIENLSGDWKILKSNTKYLKESTSKLKFALHLKASEELLLKYTIRIKH
ncbi:MAG: hypothetical protein GY817_09250 [bacterium]|nr:hypothetical protein [bacterium]